MMVSEKEIQVYTAVFQLAKDGKDLKSLRVQDIADACDMGKGTLYEYFSSKDEIIEKTVEYFFSVEVEAISEMILVEEPFEQKLRKFMLAFVHRTQKYSSLEVLVAHSENLKIPCAFENNREKIVAYVPLVVNLLDDLIKVGIAQDVLDKNESKEYLRFLLLSSLSGFVMCIKVSDNPLHDTKVLSAMESAIRIITTK